MFLAEYFKVDTTEIKQYEGTRIVSDVYLLETPKPRQRLVLCYVEYLQANCLINKKYLKN